MNNPGFFALITSLGFSWPLLARMTNLSPIGTSMMVTVGTFLMILLAGTFSPLPVMGGNAKSIVICLFAGLANGIGTIAYARIISQSDWAPTYIPVSLVLMVAIVTIGGMLFYRDPISWSKTAGLILGCASIWLLTR